MSALKKFTFNKNTELKRTTSYIILNTESEPLLGYNGLEDQQWTAVT